MTDFAARLGVGQRQPNDAHVTDMTRTKRIILPGEHKPVAAQLIEHRSGRVDATVYADPYQTTREEVEDTRRTLGMTEREMVAALNRIFKVNARSIRHVR